VSFVTNAFACGFCCSAVAVAVGDVGTLCVFVCRFFRWSPKLGDFKFK